MSANDLTSKVRELKELKMMAEEIEIEIKSIEDAIKNEMTARQTNEMTVDVYKIKWTPYTTSRVDTTALKKDMPEVVSRYTKTTVSKRFSVA